MQDGVLGVQDGDVKGGKMGMGLVQDGDMRNAGWGGEGCRIGMQGLQDKDIKGCRMRM